MKYAANTDVSAEKSRGEIELTLQRYGATGFMYGWDENKAIVGFKMKNRQIKFVLAMPDKSEKRFWYTPGRNLKRTSSQAFDAWEQATRQKWRALSLAVKAKLEAVDAGIATFEQEFLAHVVLPDGRTVGEYVTPQIEEAYLHGTMPKLLPGIGETSAK